MIYHENGKLGQLSAIGLGCWNFGGQWNKVSEQDAIEIIRYAIDNGVNFVDVAESYGIPDGQCEQILGKALKKGYRDKVFLISKVGWFGRRENNYFSSNPTIYTKFMRKVYNYLNNMKSVDLGEKTPDLVRLSGHACCGRLQTDHIDLLLCHESVPKAPMSYIKGFRQLRDEGFIRFYGISTDSLSALRHFYELSDGECSACECDYSLLNRKAEGGLFKFCSEHKIAIFTRGTLGRGLLSGKYDLQTVFQEESRKSWNIGGRDRKQYELLISKVNRLQTLFHTKYLSEIAYRFAFSRLEHPSVVVGCTSLEQIKENIKISSEYLFDDIMAVIEQQYN